MTSLYTVRVAFLDVGQGDSIVVSIPETHEAVIIDCPDAATALEYLQSQNIRHIRGMLITHLHLDHFKDTVKFLENCNTQLGIQCERLVFNWPQNGKVPPSDADRHDDGHPDDMHNQRQRRTAYQELLSWAYRHEDACVGLVCSKNQTPLTGNIASVIKILQPSHAQMGKLLTMGLNNTSAILRVEGLATSALLTADLEPKGWAELQIRYPNLHSDVLKFPHHGAWKDANPQEILDAVQPSVVLISVGTDGIKYEHPNVHVFQSIACYPHIRLLCTQATNQCNSDVLQVRSMVIKTLEQEASSYQMPLIRIARGCPCAGTIILDLGEHVQILQPEATFHQVQIIEQYFQNHQCM